MVLLDMDYPAPQTEEREEAMEGEVIDQAAILKSLSVKLCEYRQEAIDGRMSSGIEDIWAEDEEYYEGIDDANRHETKLLRKPLTHTGGSDGSIRGKKSGVRSTVFVPITRPYVDAASARVADMLLPNDDANWGIKPTPIPDIESAMKDTTPMIGPDAQPIIANGMDESGNPVERPLMVKDMAQQAMDEATNRCKAAEKRITDWHVECQYHAEVRKVIESSARLGTGILKGPFPKRKTGRKMTMANGFVEFVQTNSIDPASKCIDLWNFYPDANCGKNIHDGRYVFEREELTSKKLKELIGQPGYIDDAIIRVIKEGPGQSETRKDKRQYKDSERFEIWHFTGHMSREEIMSIGHDCDDYEGEEIPIVAALVNNEVVRITVSPLESGQFPYDVMVWQERDQHWSGVGVARQGRTAQQMVNASTRALLDNTWLSSMPQTVLRKNGIIPADGSWELYAGKLWLATDDDGDGKPFETFDIPSRQEQVTNVIQYGMKLFEDSVGLPQLLQGQLGTAPDTVGGMQMLQNNASGVLRRIARIFDDRITEPHIRRYYEWLMLFGEDENEKGDWLVDARGSTALFERDQQNQFIFQMAQIVANPAFGLDPEKWAEELLRGQRIDPNRVKMEDAKKEQMRQMASQQPQDTSLQVAQLRGQTDMQKAKMVQQADMAELEFKAQEAERIRQHDYAMRQMEYEMRMIEFAQERNIRLEDVKAQLSMKAVDSRDKRDLFNAEAIIKRTQGSGI